jgi:ABC-type Zn2+ transport system substrate-binding protein/surface adhesin
MWVPVQKNKAFKVDTNGCENHKSTTRNQTKGKEQKQNEHHEQEQEQEQDYARKHDHENPRRSAHVTLTITTITNGRNLDGPQLRKDVPEFTARERLALRTQFKRAANAETPNPK